MTTCEAPFDAFLVVDPQLDAQGGGHLQRRSKVAACSEVVAPGHWCVVERMRNRENAAQIQRQASRDGLVYLVCRGIRLGDHTLFAAS